MISISQRSSVFAVSGRAAFDVLSHPEASIILAAGLTMAQIVAHDLFRTLVHAVVSPHHGSGSIAHPLAVTGGSIAATLLALTFCLGAALDRLGESNGTVRSIPQWIARTCHRSIAFGWIALIVLIGLTAILSVPAVVATVVADRPALLMSPHLVLTAFALTSFAVTEAAMLIGMASIIALDRLANGRKSLRPTLLDAVRTFGTSMVLILSQPLRATALAAVMAALTMPLVLLAGVLSTTAVAHPLTITAVSLYAVRATCWTVALLCTARAFTLGLWPTTDTA